MSIDHPNPPLPPLTAEEFNDGVGYTFRGVPIVGDERGDWIYAYGHVDPETMAGAVNDFDDENGNPPVVPEDRYTVDDVQHTYAVTIKGPGDPDGWWISWHDVTAETPGSFALTVVSR